MILGNSELLIRMASNGDIPAFLGRGAKGSHAYASVLLSGGIAVILMVTGGIETIITYCSVAGIVGLVFMDLTALQLARGRWATPGITLPFGILIPALAGILALSQLPSLGAQNVVIGLLLVAVGLVVYALRGRTHPDASRSSHAGDARSSSI